MTDPPSLPVTLLEQPALDELQRRQSAKWRDITPGELPAWVAESDFGLPASVKATLLEAVENGDTGYSSAHSRELPQAFAEFARRHWQWSIDDGQVTSVPDAVAAIELALRRTTRPGDAVAMFFPAYQPFFETLSEVGARVAPLRFTSGDNEWTVDFDHVSEVLSSGVRVLLLNNPHNPIGKAFSVAELSEIAALTSRHNVFVISDEAHAPLVMQGRHHPWPTIKGSSAQNSIVITGATKAFNLAGLKCALAIGVGTAAGVVDSFPTEFKAMTGHLGVLASAAAYRSEDPWLAAFVRHLADHVDMINAWVEARPDVDWIAPQATYLAWLDLRQTAIAHAPAQEIRRRSGLVVIDGTEFDPEHGRGWIRLNFATTRVLMDDILKRLTKSIETVS